MAPRRKPSTGSGRSRRRRWRCQTSADMATEISPDELRRARGEFCEVLKGRGRHREQNGSVARACSSSSGKALVGLLRRFAPRKDARWDGPLILGRRDVIASRRRSNPSPTLGEATYHLKLSSEP